MSQAGGAAAGGAGAGGGQGGSGGAPNAPGTPGQGAPAGGGSGVGQTADWMSSFSEDTRGYLQNKGFKDPSALADSYRNLEKLVGVKERLVQLPESMESAEMSAVWERLGKPKDAKSYNLQVPEKGGDPKLAEWASDVFHKSNLTASQANAVMKAWNERQVETSKATLDNQKASIMQADAKLKQEWGMAYDQNLNLAKSGMSALGLDAKSVDALESVIGREALFKKLSEIGRGVGEAPFISGRPAGDGVVTPEQARNQISELQRDQGFIQAYLKGDFDAKKRMESLQKMAFPGEHRL